MTEQEYRQDDRTEGYCPLCRQPVTTVFVDGAGWCPDHGRVWCDWTPPRNAGGTDKGYMYGSDGLTIGRKDMSDRELLKPLLDKEEAAA